MLRSNFLKKAKILPLLGVLLIPAVSGLWAKPADPEHRWAEARVAFIEGQPEQALEALTPLLASGTQASQRLQEQAWMLAGKSLLALSRPQEARTWFARVQQSDHEHYDLWLYYRLESRLQAQEYAEAASVLDALLKHSRYESHLPRIREQLLAHLQTPEASAPFIALLDDPKSPAQHLLEDYRIHRLHRSGREAQGRPLEKSEWLQAWQHPIDLESAQESQKVLQKEKLSPSDAEVRQRVSSLRSLRLYDHLIEELPSLMKGRSKELRVHLGKSYINSLFRARNYSQMVRIYHRGEYGKRYSVPRAYEYYWMMRAYQRLKRTKDARFLLYKLEKEFPDSGLLPLAYEYMGSYYQAQREPKKAAFWWRRFLERVPSHQDRGEMLWNMAWHHSRGKGYLTANKYLEQGLEQEQLGPETKAKFLYWRGKFHLRLKQQDAARQSFELLVSQLPNTYYGLRLKLEEPKWAQAAPPASALKPEDQLELSSSEAKLIKHCEFLFEVGDGDLALLRLQIALKGKPSEALVRHTGKVLEQHHQYHALQKLVTRHFFQDLKSSGLSQHPAWIMAFPRPYWEQVQRYSEDAGIDPYWALSIMREESLFDPQAVSSANALGLMQLMPATAKDVARWNKMNVRIPEDIFDPQINTRLGTSYLGRLAGRFEDELIFTAGSYNAGPGNMKNWLKRIQYRSLEEFVEDIPFEETREYVKRVYRTYQIYKLLYQS